MSIYRYWSLVGLALFLSILAQQAWAHETPIALLDIREISSQPGIYNTKWTFSSSTKLKPPTAVYPENCLEKNNVIDCGEEGLSGQLTIERLGASYSGVVVRVSRIDMPTQSYTLTGTNPSVLLSPDGQMPISQVFSSFVPLGIEHILLGIDHLLFVFFLILLVHGIGPLIKTITAFTVAHSITLGAATFGWIGISESSVNAAIALSIVVLAVEVIKDRQGERSWTSDHPWVIAFGFGLLHGMGFASALTDIGLSSENLPAALLFFNIGVEIGQFVFVFLVLGLWWSLRQLHVGLSRRWELIGIYSVGSIASFWFIQRLWDIAFPKFVL